MQCRNDVLWNCTSENYTILFTSFTKINSIKINYFSFYHIIGQYIGIFEIMHVGKFYYLWISFQDDNGDVTKNIKKREWVL